MDRRSFLASTAALPLASALPSTARAQDRTFTPTPVSWRTYEITTRLEVVNAGPGTQAWVPGQNSPHRAGAGPKPAAESRRWSS